MSPSISVALCTHNGAAYVADQVVSILDQSVAPSEIVLSDDASADGTVDIAVGILERWNADHPGAQLRICVLRNEAPLGVTANFEQALAACTGELIALCDQDDVWHADKLKRMSERFADEPELLLLGSDARIVDGSGAPTGETLLHTLYVSPDETASMHSGRGLQVLLRRNILTGATVLLRRELVTRSRPFPASWVHDEWLAVVGAATGRIDVLEEPLIDYRQHGGNQIGASTLTVAGKVGRLRAPRTARNQRLLARAVALHERAATVTPVPSPSALTAIAGKVAHENKRNTLPAARIRRMRPILRMWLSGGYARYGLGFPDLLRDLVQPA